MIPASLTSIPRWILWRYEVRDDKATKVPCDVSGHPAAVNDPKSWLTYADATAAVELGNANGPQFAGVGFCFTADDDIFGIDLDECMPLRDDAKEILERFSTYAEVSPSGKGVKLIGRGKKPEGTRNRTSEVRGFKQIEVYDRDRFFTITGNQFGFATEVADVQPAMNWMADKFLAPPTPDQGERSAPAPVAGSSLLQRAAGYEGTDAELVALLLSDEKYARLWHADDSDYGDDASVGDLALAEKLAWLVGPVPERIEGILLTSPRAARKKWDREDYRRRTIAKALEGKTSFYTAPSARPFDSDTRRLELTPEQAAQLGAHGWQPISLVGEARAMAAVGPPEVGGGLFYTAQRHLFSGEADVGKTWVALWAASQEIAAGHPVMWVNTDDAPAGELVERLGLFSVTEDSIEKNLVYLAPGYKTTVEDIPALAGIVRDREIRLVVVDSFNPALMLEGRDPNSTVEVDAFLRTMVSPLVAAGAAVVLIDHLPKNQENHGRYSYGSERKLSGVSSHIGARGKGWSREDGGGQVILWNLKDRSGHRANPRKPFARFTLNTNDIIARGMLEAYTDDGDSSRPTALMERVSRFMEGQSGEEFSKRALVKEIEGKEAYLATAIDALVAEGYVTIREGDRGAIMHTLSRPFVVES